MHVHSRTASVLPRAIFRLAMALAVASLRVAAQGAAPDTVPVRGLPLVEAPSSRPGRLLAIFLTGDGGWAMLDRSVARVLTDSGIAVVGFNSRSYVERRRTPDEAARDLARVARHYLASWHRDRLLLVGYSRGADLLPFVATRLPQDLRSATVGLAMLGLARTASFQFHLVDLFRDIERPGDPAILPEIQRLRGTPMLCVFGTGEERSACRDADPSLIARYSREGDHHFDGAYGAIGEIIVAATRRWMGDERADPARPPAALTRPSARRSPGSPLP